MVRAFDWHDGERLIRFGRGTAAGAVESLGGPGYALLTTERAAAALPAVPAAAGAVHAIAPGAVDALAATALDWARERAPERVVALGGGRVIDVAKAVAAALGGGTRALAIPTTLSGAEMTQGHRHATGVPDATPRVRCAVVVFDPALAASQPLPELAASACNALGHAIEGPCTTAANPVATLAAQEAARLLVGALADPAAPDRDALALGALLAGYTIDSTGLGLHHVLAQTLVRHGLAGHGQANAQLLPHTTAALARRAPDRIAALAAVLGEDPAAAAARVRSLTGADGLRALGGDESALGACVEAALARPQLGNTPPRPDAAELRAIYGAAW